MRLRPLGSNRDIRRDDWPTETEQESASEAKLATAREVEAPIPLPKSAAGRRWPLSASLGPW